MTGLAVGSADIRPSAVESVVVKADAPLCEVPDRNQLPFLALSCTPPALTHRKHQPEPNQLPSPARQPIRPQPHRHQPIPRRDHHPHPNPVRHRPPHERQGERAQLVVQDQAAGQGAGLVGRDGEEVEEEGLGRVEEDEERDGD